MKISDCPKVESIDKDDVLLLDGANGTKTIKIKENFTTNLIDGAPDESVNLRGGASSLSTKTMSLGKNTIAGSKCFNITAFDDENNAYTLDSVEGLEIGDVFSIKIFNNYDEYGTITAINGTTVTVSKYHKDEANTTERIFWIPEKPACGTTDFGIGAIASGEGCWAIGNGSHATGNNTKAKGRYSHTEGNKTSAGYAAHAEGRKSVASGVCAHAEGDSTVASGIHSHAEGRRTAASDLGAHAEGTDTKAKKEGSHAEGGMTEADGKWSHAEGYGTRAMSNAQHVDGRFNIPDINHKYAHITGNGTAGDDAHRSNAYTLDWHGNAWFAGTVEAKAIILKSATAGSTKRFKVTVDDNGKLTTTEIK